LVEFKRDLDAADLWPSLEQNCGKQDHVWITQDHVWITTDHFIRFHKDEFDEVPRKLAFTEYATSFEQNPTLP